MRSHRGLIVPFDPCQSQGQRPGVKLPAMLWVKSFHIIFVASWFARELNEITFIGPLGFYMGAQGSLIIYVVIIWYYARYMNNMDQE